MHLLVEGTSRQIQLVEHRLDIALMARQGGDAARTSVLHKVHLRYEGTDSPLIVDFADPATMVGEFEEAHHQHYGFIAPDDGGKDIFVHISAVERAGLGTLQEGQKVNYELVDGRDGRPAADNLSAPE